MRGINTPSWCSFFAIVVLVSPVISACIRLHGLFWGLTKVSFFITFFYAFILMRVTKGNGACKISKRKAQTCIWYCGYWIEKPCLQHKIIGNVKVVHIGVITSAQAVLWTLFHIWNKRSRTKESKEELPKWRITCIARASMQCLKGVELNIQSMRKRVLRVNGMLGCTFFVYYIWQIVFLIYSNIFYCVLINYPWS